MRGIKSILFPIIALISNAIGENIAQISAIENGWRIFDVLYSELQEHQEITDKAQWLLTKNNIVSEAPSNAGYFNLFESTLDILETPSENTLPRVCQFGNIAEAYSLYWRHQQTENARPLRYQLWAMLFRGKPIAFQTMERENVFPSDSSKNLFGGLIFALKHDDLFKKYWDSAWAQNPQYVLSRLLWTCQAGGFVLSSESINLQTLSIPENAIAALPIPQQTQLVILISSQLWNESPEFFEQRIRENKNFQKISKILSGYELEISASQQNMQIIVKKSKPPSDKPLQLTVIHKPLP